MINKLSEKSNWATKYKIISLYNNLLDTYRNYLKVEWWIISLERWLIWDDWTTIFEDYFENTHENLREKYNLNNSYAITKINLSNWTHMLLATIFKKQLLGKWIKFLDTIQKNMHPTMSKILDEKLHEIHYIEHEYFKNKRAKEIKEKNKKNLIKTLK